MAANLGTTIFRVLVVYVLGVLAAMTVSEAVPQMSAIGAEFHPSNPAMIGLIMSLPSLMVAIGALGTGWLVDRFGDKLILFCGAGIVIVGDALVILAPSLQLLLVGRAVSGIGYVFMAVSAITLLVRITSGKNRTMALALWSTFVPISFMLPFMTAPLVAAAGNWRVAFIGHVVVLALFLVVGLLALPGRGVGAFQPSRTAGLGAVLRSPWPYLLGISFAGDSFLHVGVMATLAPYLHGRFGVPEMQIDGLNAVAMLTNMAGCLLVGALLNRELPQLAIGAAALALTGLPLVAMYALPVGFNTAIGLSWLFMFGSGLFTGMWALLPCCAPTPQSVGATSGLVTQFTLFGVLLSGPVCFAAISAPGNGPIMLVVIVALAVCMARVPIWIRGAIPHAIAAPSAAAGE